ncbi:MAG: YceI family protein [Pseudomonadota bacterium]|nr:YceI family protein [Pseudomonadota bacterium]
MRFSLMLLPLLPLLFVAGTGWADQMNLRPPGAAVELRTYGFGVIPFDGNFTRFHGWMRYDPTKPGACQVQLEIEAGSLAMENEAIRDRITGPGMMNVARFPDLAFRGTCQGHGAAMVGDLTMHGETHPVTLGFTHSAGTIVASGELRRAQWGITGSPLLGGSMIRIKVVVPDPFNALHT